MRLFVLPLLAAGCTDRIPTSELSGRVETTIREREIRVDVAILQPGGHYGIEPDEHVLIGFRDQVVDSLFRDHADPQEASYGARFAIDGDVAADEPITVTLDRASLGKVELVGDTPSPFTLDAPPTASLAQDLEVRWAPASEEGMHWYLRRCLYEGGEGPIPGGVGTITFPRVVLHSDRCGYAEAVKLDLTRAHVSNPTTALYSTSVTITQVRSAAIEITP